MAAFKIPNTPSMTASVQEFADYLELLCLVNDGEYSINDAQTKIDIISDEDDQEAIINEDDALFDNLQLALEEIDRRGIACKGNYPFISDRNQISFLNAQDEPQKSLSLIYKYLLLATRLNMLKRKIVNDVDGTLLFEEISAIAAKNHFGSNADSYVFGTGAAGGFKEKVNILIEKIEEGDHAREPEFSTNDERDGGLDVVVWKPFADKSKGKLIGFGQCKTGTEWRKLVADLVPADFCKDYFSVQPTSTPIKLFFVCESFRENWETIGRKAGLLFDRCRVMEYLSEFHTQDHFDLLARIERWVKGNLDFVINSYS